MQVLLSIRNVLSQKVDVDVDMQKFTVPQLHVRDKKEKVEKPILKSYFLATIHRINCQ